MTDVILDLFGQPVLQRREGLGRPEHVWTKENSQKINLLFACGRDVKDVAAAIGISQPTLRKHYFSECAGRKVAAMRMRALQLTRLNDQAEIGNVAAEKALAAMIQAERIQSMNDRMTATPRGKAEPKPAKLGKKEEARAAAHGVSGKFAPPPAPLLN